MSPKHLSIFLSSPGDVAEERELARKFIKEQLAVSPFLRGRVTFDAVSWDDPQAGTPTPAHLTPQAAIDCGLKRPSECDIVIVILWSRIGTRLPIETYRKADGSAYMSGTEWEFEDAMRAAQSQGSPTILVYRRVEIPQLIITLTEQELEKKRAQWASVGKFFEQFRNTDGSYKGGTHEYKSSLEFIQLLGQHLQVVVRDLLEKDGTNPHEADFGSTDRRTEKSTIIERYCGTDTTHFTGRAIRSRSSRHVRRRRESRHENI